LKDNKIPEMLFKTVLSARGVGEWETDNFPSSFLFYDFCFHESTWVSRLGSFLYFSVYDSVVSMALVLVSIFLYLKNLCVDSNISTL
jgi:hypothetical protein